MHHILARTEMRNLVRFLHMRDDAQFCSQQLKKIIQDEYQPNQINTTTCNLFFEQGQFLMV